MIFRPWRPAVWVLAILSSTSAQRVLQSKSLDSCQDNSSFEASLFNVVYTPDNGSVSANVVALSSVQGNVKFDIKLNVYGWELLHETIDPCSMDPPILCPLTTGKISLKFNLPISDSVSNMVPAIAYTFPDLDASIKVLINETETGESISCLEASFANTQTVDLIYIKWATAVVILVGLLTSAIMSGIGYTNTAAHLAASTLSLFAYFQAQAMVGLSGVRLPPAANAWTRNFMWSLGIIRVNWMQDVFTWFQRATGGKPATLLNNALFASVHIMKRSIDTAVGALTKRANIQLDTGAYVVYGIQRVAYLSKIESTNMVMTSITFFSILIIFSAILVAIFYGILVLCVNKGWVSRERFPEFHDGGWEVVLKGILLRMAVAGFPAVTIFALWEFTQIDSPAIAVIAVIYMVGIIGTLGWASFRIIALGRYSTTVYNTPSYLLFSNPNVLYKWGFLYVPFRASAYYYVLPIFVYIFVKAAVIAYGQHNGVAQAICLIITEVTVLAAASIMRPWMDKTTNILNIAIGVVNFLNAIFLFLLNNVFSAPGLLVGVVGILIFIVNAIFSLVLLLLVIGSSIVSFIRKNPDNRYRTMDDDRVSFWKSRTQLDLSQELDALAVTARGEDVSDSQSHDTRSPSPGDRRNTSRAHVRSFASRSQVEVRQGEDISTMWPPIDPATPLTREGEHQRSRS